MTGGINVQYFRQEVDVALYGRKCSKYLRNNVRESHSLSDFSKFKMYLFRKITADTRGP